MNRKSSDEYSGDLTHKGNLNKDQLYEVAVSLYEDLISSEDTVKRLEKEALERGAKNKTLAEAALNSSAAFSECYESLVAFRDKHYAYRVAESDLRIAEVAAIGTISKYNKIYTSLKKEKGSASYALAK